MKRLTQIALAALLLLAPGPGAAQAVAVETCRVEAAIQVILLRGIPRYKIRCFPHHPLARDASARAATAAAIAQAAATHRVPPLLLTAIAFREGGFRHEAIGTLQERTMFQLMGHVATAVRSGRVDASVGPAVDCDLRTVAGSAQCAAALLRACYHLCGGQSWDAAALRYVTGNQCRPTNEISSFIARDRTGIAEALLRATEDAPCP